MRVLWYLGMGSVDYVLLEEAARVSDNAVKDRLGLVKKARFGHGGLKMKLLVKAAGKRGIRFKLLSAGMSRRKDNVSMYNIKEDVIYWKCRVKFKENVIPNGAQIVSENKDAFTFDVHRFSDKEPVRKLIEQFCVANKDCSNAIVRHRLLPYNVEYLPKEEGLQALAVFIEAEGRTDKREPRFHRLSLDAPLCNALKDISVLEHPLIHVCMKKDAEVFSSLEEDCASSNSSDDESSSSSKQSSSSESESSTDNSSEDEDEEQSKDGGSVDTGLTLKTITDITALASN